jgi:hypothetical protein
MRDRHFPRLCRHCRAPMARQEDSCWRCGTEWAIEEKPRTTLRLIPGGADTRFEDADRWTNEGGSFAAEVALALPAAAATR